MCVCAFFFFSLPPFKLEAGCGESCLFTLRLPTSFFTEREDWIKLRLIVELRGLGA